MEAAQKASEKKKKMEEQKAKESQKVPQIEAPTVGGSSEAHPAPDAVLARAVSLGKNLAQPAKKVQSEEVEALSHIDAEQWRNEIVGNFADNFGYEEDYDDD